jgi:signal transduction histidine kinase
VLEHRRSRSSQAQSIDLGLGGFGAIAIILSLVGLTIPDGRPEHLAITAFLAASGVVLGATTLRIELGVVSLSAVAIQVAAGLLSPLEASVVGAAATAPRAYQRRHLDHLPYSFMGAFDAAMGAACRLVLDHIGAPPSFAIVAAVLMSVFANVIGTGLIGTRIAQAPILVVWRRALTRTMGVAYAFFIAESLLAIDLLSRGAMGYVEAATVFALTLPFVYTIFGRRWLRQLEGQLGETDRLAMYGQAVEVVLHGLRNNVATASAALDDLARSLTNESLATAVMALTDARSVLSGIAELPSSGDAFKLSELDLSDIARQTIAATRYRAEAAGVTLALHDHPTSLLVLGHPVLLREATTNLVLNAIEAIPGGRVYVEVGRRADNWAYVSVRDSGLGLTDERRRRLFEPHATTKGVRGMGIGLFVSSGIARQHFGRLYYEGGRRRGGVFTLALPPLDRSRAIVRESASR